MPVQPDRGEHHAKTSAGNRANAGRRAKPRNRSKIDFFLDFALTIIFAAEMEVHFTGLLLHEWIGLALAALLALHIVLHWSWVVSITQTFFRKLIHESRLNYVLNAALFVDVVVVMVTGIAVSETLGLNFGLRGTALIDRLAGDSRVVVASVLGADRRACGAAWDADMPAGVFDHAFDYLTHVDETFSTFKDTSEVSQLNRGDLTLAQASAELREILALAEQTRRETNGYFDVMRGGVLNPSGIVKRIVMGDGGVATSGLYQRGRHIYNPHDFDDALDQVASLTVVAPNVHEADRFATAAFAMGPAGIGYIASLSGFEGYAITHARRATMTPGFQHLVESEP